MNNSNVYIYFFCKNCAKFAVSGIFYLFVRIGRLQSSAVEKSYKANTMSGDDKRLKEFAEKELKYPVRQKAIDCYKKA